MTIFGRFFKFLLFSTISDYRSKGALIHELRGWNYSNSELESSINLELRKAGGNLNRSSFTPSDALIVQVPDKLWETILRNGSSVFLHTFVLLDDLLNDPSTKISKSSLSSGKILHGVVQMVKYDKVPLYFRHRLLLSDFGLVEMDPLDGKDKYYFH